MVVVWWEFWCLSWEHGENLLLQLMCVPCISKGVFVVIKVEFSFFTSTFLPESQFNTFPGIIELISLPLYIEKIEMLVIPCHVFTIVTLSVSCLLELEHVQSGFRPRAACKQKFSAKVVCELLDVENVNPLRLSQ